MTDCMTLKWSVIRFYLNTIVLSKLTTAEPIATPPAVTAICCNIDGWAGAAIDGATADGGGGAAAGTRDTGAGAGAAAAGRGAAAVDNGLQTKKN